jgi:O-antigen/teichoic acid export membrane protein
LRTEDAAAHPVVGQTLEQADSAACRSPALEGRRMRHHDQDTQGCESMTHMITRTRALTRGLFHGGAAGDASLAKGREIATNVSVQFAARAITMALSVVTVALTARTLDRNGYGVWNGVGSYVALFGILTDLGFTIAATQRMAAEPERESEWLGALIGIRVAMSVVVMVLCACSIPLLLTNTDQSHTVGYIMTATTATTGASALMAVFQSRLRAGLVLSFTVLQGVLWLSTVAVLAAMHGSVVAFALAQALIVILISILQVNATRRFAHIAWRAGMRLWRTLLRVALPLGIASVMITIYYQVDSVLLLQIAGPGEAGIYGAAYGFMSPLNFLPAAVMASFFPVLSAVYHHDAARARRLVQICAEIMAVVGLPVLAGTIALSGPIIHLIYGPKFHEAAGLLPILMIAFVIICYGSLAGFLAPLLGLQWRFALYTSIGAAANVALNLVLIPTYGAHGSAWATVATEALTMTPMMITALWAMRLRLKLGKIARTVLLAAAMTGLMALTEPLGLFPAGIIGVLAYLAGLFALRIVNQAEMRVLLRRSEPTAEGLV